MSLDVEKVWGAVQAMAIAAVAASGTDNVLIGSAAIICAIGFAVGLSAPGLRELRRWDRDRQLARGPNPKIGRSKDQRGVLE